MTSGFHPAGTRDRASSQSTTSGYEALEAVLQRAALTDVDTTYAMLKAADIPFRHEPRDIHGGYVFYCTAPGNILVEVGWRPD